MYILLPRSWFEPTSYLLGATLFANKSDTRVSLSLLQLLEHVEKIGSYAWVAVNFAHMYHQLGIASHAKVTLIGGYMTLLEGWMYDHIPFIEPTLRSDYSSDKP
ncbi:hypothetical protein Scep_010004 [Stephania cephalantha]|uniref:Aminotransferase-like plant mobile domain-containing protein n=1 Tax=Stephania cephalantha TaxID=152367 RepID=A0AAP0JU73_9MAGN